MKKIAFLVLIIALAIFGYFKFQNNYEYIQPKIGSVTDTIYGLGKVKSKNIYEAKVGISTTISRIFVKEGQAVNKGAPLIGFNEAGLFKAPFAGTVTSVNVEEGELAQPNIALIQLKNLDDKYIEVSLEQSAALKVKKSQKAQIIFDITKNKVMEGVVTTIFPRNEEFIAHIEVENIQRNILPGMTADTVIIVGKKDDVLLIPLKATSMGRVTRIRNHQMKKIDVTLGHNDQYWAELIDGDIKLEDKLLMKKN